MSGALDVSRLGRGFSNLVLDSQASFREILQALARPGEIRTLSADVEPPEGFDPATAILLLTLADADAPVYLCDAARTGEAYVRFHCGASLVEPKAAAFGVLFGAEGEPSLLDFDAGVDLYPDRSATVFIQVRALEGGADVRLSGPGIAEAKTVAPDGLASDFWDEFAANAARFPLGADVILAAGRRIMGLPRSASTDAYQTP